MILKVEPATLSEIEMMNLQTVIISAIQLKTRTKAFCALSKENHLHLAFEYIKDEDGTYPAVHYEIAGTASF
jgi:alanine dehydrogenase